ncbi:MAG: family 16 glycosylhydrolase, partial [Planctomycetes bacterium]|nr:family 16 glycosylhydrolase [Planctomycetota bacterium]
CAPSDEGYPGVTIVAPEGGWDLSQCGRVETTVTNVGEAPLYLTLRVDNAGDWRKNPWNASSVSIAPGKSATLRTTFGYSWDKPGYKLDSSKVSQVLLFTGKAGKPLKYRIENLRGAGAAGEKPRGLTEKVRPADGTLWSASEKIDPERLHGMNGGVAKAEAAGIAIDLPAPTGNRRAAVAIDPKAGELWDLSLCSEATFSVKNVGDAPLKLLCRLDNNNPRDDAINCAVARAEIPAGATREVTVAFVTDKVFDFNKKDSGFVFGSDAVHRATLVNDGPAGGKALLTAIKGKKRAARPPEWLGKRPPVPGNWKMTFEDNFDGKEIDRAKWVFPADDLSVPDPDGNCNRSIISIWDKLSLNTANNVLAGDGHMTLRVTKMQDPQAEAKKLAEKLFGDKIGERAEEVKKMQQRRYLSTVITTFDRFAQKYGYFEARMKLADGLGMWPAFWLMPDRGKEAGIWWKRNATDHGGMQCDVRDADSS